MILLIPVVTGMHCRNLELLPLSHELRNKAQRLYIESLIISQTNVLKVWRELC